MFFCPYAIVYAEVAKIHGDAEAADEIIAEARQYCKENNFKKRYELLCSFGQEQKAPIDPEEKKLSCSIGIAMGIVGGGEGRKEQINEILRKADTMMYSVKHTTKHTYTFFS